MVYFPNMIWWFQFPEIHPVFGFFRTFRIFSNFLSFNHISSKKVWCTWKIWYIIWLFHFPENYPVSRYFQIYAEILQFSDFSIFNNPISSHLWFPDFLYVLNFLPNFRFTSIWTFSLKQEILLYFRFLKDFITCCVYKQNFGVL